MTTGPFDGPFMGDFPNRPDHPDFWTLSEAVLQMDGKTEDPTFDMAAHIASLVDPEVIDPTSLVYFLQQRVGMALQQAARLLAQPGGQEIVVQSVWLDAFMLGATFAERRRQA